MAAQEQERAFSRRVVAQFIAITLLPAAGLVWLGWRLAEQDRALEVQRQQERREHAADLAAAALESLLTRAEQQLSVPSSVPVGFPVITLRRDGLAGRSGRPLPFYPAAPVTPEALPSIFATADSLEFREKRYRDALGILRPLAASKDAAVRAGALLRMARISRKTGDTSAALHAYGELAAVSDIAVDGAPADLAGMQGSALLYEETGQANELRRTAEAIVRGLDEGRWMLRRAAYELQKEQLGRWLSQRFEADSRSLALAEAAAIVWQRWQSTPASMPARLPIAASGQSLLALVRPVTNGIKVGLIGADYLAASWAPEPQSNSSVQVALSDAEGRPVLGRIDAPPAKQSVRTAVVTGLPWTIQAAIRDEAPTTVPGRSGLLLAGVLCMAALVLGSGYFAWRGITHELKVARLESEFVASVSHEFRTPITTIRQLSEMLVHGRVSSDERRSQFYEVLLRESDRLHRLVEGLLQFGRMDSGQMPMQFEPLDPAELVREVTGEFESLAARSGHRVEFDAPESLPRVRGDRASLSRVLWNLLDNAVKYSPGSPTVWVNANAEAGGVAIRVRDGGLGIAPGERDRIFRKFVRGAASKEAAIPGTGIGLALAKRIIDAHGGTLTVESRRGEGSEFAVVLPTGE